MKILVINAGSSSLKYQLLDPATGELLAKGLCERIGIDGKFTYKPQLAGKQVLDAVDVAMPTHSEAIKAVMDALVDADNGVIASMSEIDAVGTNSFPDGYYEKKGAIQAFFEALMREYEIDADKIGYW